jgi:signal peptidase I
VLRPRHPRQQPVGRPGAAGVAVAAARARRPGSIPRRDDTAKTAIRRVIGLPGDRVQLRDYRVLINDTLLPTDRVGETEIADAQGRRVPVVRLHETMTRGIRGYDILVPQDSTNGSGTSPLFTVPLRFIYVLADNRATTANIRTPAIGIVPVVNLIALLSVARAK